MAALPALADSLVKLFLRGVPTVKAKLTLPSEKERSLPSGSRAFAVPLSFLFLGKQQS